MALTPNQLHVNAKLTLDDKEYSVEQTDSRLTYLSAVEDNDAGEVVIYRTDVVTEKANQWVDPEVAAAAQENETEDQRRIRELEAQLAEVRAHQAASQPGSGSVATQTGNEAGTQNEPSPTGQDVGGTNPSTNQGANQ